MTPRRRPAGVFSQRLSGSLLVGALLGLAVALLLQAAMQRTATPLPPVRALWQLLLLSVAGGLAGFAISAVSALQAANPDPEYRHTRRSLRPSGRRPPPEG